VHSAAHAVSLCFAPEFGGAPSGARTLFSPRRRCEIRSNFDIVFALDTKRIFAILEVYPIQQVVFFDGRLGQFKATWIGYNRGGL
jgi:hypothetical protein